MAEENDLVNMTKYECPYPECKWEGVSDSQLTLHCGFVHASKQEMGDQPARRAKRMESKLPQFLASESNDEFRRKRMEFTTYADRAGISGKEEEDDLYRTCETPLKRKLLASNKIRDVPKDTDPAVMMEEIERLSCPKVNVIVERQQFRLMTQEGDENITSFESRVRAKARVCGFKNCGCNKVCKTCGFDREEDEIKERVLLGMKDRDLQCELWRKSEIYKTLDDVLGAIRASEAATEQQSVLSGATNQASDVTRVKKCYNCNKEGHISTACPDKPARNTCGFCGGVARCKPAKTCKAYNSKCHKCNKYGHFAACCNEFTRSKARAKAKAQRVDEDSEPEDQASTVRVSKVSVLHEGGENVATHHGVPHGGGEVLSNLVTKPDQTPVVHLLEDATFSPEDTSVMEEEVEDVEKMHTIHVNRVCMAPVSVNSIV